MSASDRQRILPSREKTCPCCATKSPAGELRCIACGQILPRRKPPAASGSKTRSFRPAEDAGIGESEADSRVQSWGKPDGGFVIEVAPELEPGSSIEFDIEPQAERGKLPDSIEDTPSADLLGARAAYEEDDELPETRTYFGTEPAPRVEPEEDEEDLSETRTYAAAEAAAEDLEPGPDPADEPSVLNRWSRPTPPRNGEEDEEDEEDEEVEQVSGMFGITAGSPQAKHFCESTKRRC